MKVALLPKKTRGETVQARACRSHQGDEKSLNGKSPAARSPASMLDARHEEARPAGVRGHARPAAREARVRRRRDVADAPRRDRARAICPTRCASTAETLREPAFPADEFEKLKRERDRRARRAAHRSGERSRGARARALGNPYPAGRRPLRADVRRGARDRTQGDARRREGASTRFVGGATAELAIVGDFDPDAVAGAASRRCSATGRAPRRTRACPNRWWRSRPTALTLETPDKANATLFGHLPLPINDASDDYARRRRQRATSSARRGSRGCGTASASGRPELRRRCRAARRGSFEENSPLYVYAIFAPQNRERLVSGARPRSSRGARDGFTEAEVAEAKAALLRRGSSRARAGSRALAGALVQQAYLGRTLGIRAKSRRGHRGRDRRRRQRGAAQVREAGRLRVVYAGTFGR